MRFSNEVSLAWDDVLILPTKTSQIESRLNVSLNSTLAKWEVVTPLLASPMDKVVNLNAAVALAQQGVYSCFHRFQSVEDQVAQVKNFSMLFPEMLTIAAISANIEDPLEKKRMEDLSKWCDLFIIDTAMGTNTKVLRAIEFLKQNFKGLPLIAGNVVTVAACLELVNAGVDGVRVGIGSGSHCITRQQTGVGRGNLTAVVECSKICRPHNVTLICDGGAKALAAGADILMMGSPFAAHDESPGNSLYVIGDREFSTYNEAAEFHHASGSLLSIVEHKEYRGMASKEAQEDFKGSLKKGTTFEGMSSLFKVKGPLVDTVDNFLGGIRSSMSYVNASNLKEFRENVVFEQLSYGAQKESYVRS
jgi:IMP dehydrogenase